jgi:hypothetical protein
VEGLLLPLLKIDVIIFSLIPIFETGTYNQTSLCLIPPWAMPGTPSPQWKNSSIFGGGSID